LNGLKAITFEPEDKGSNSPVQKKPELNSNWREHSRKKTVPWTFFAKGCTN